MLNISGYTLIFVEKMEWTAYERCFCIWCTSYRIHALTKLIILLKGLSCRCLEHHEPCLNKVYTYKNVFSKLCKKHFYQSTASIYSIEYLESKIYTFCKLKSLSMFVHLFNTYMHETWFITQLHVIIDRKKMKLTCFFPYWPQHVK